MNFSKEEINLGLIVTKYEEALAKNTSKAALKATLLQSIIDIESVNNISEKTISNFPGIKFLDNISFQDEQSETDPQLLVDLELDLLGDGALSNYLEKCFNCSGRVNFQAQLLPDLDIAGAFEDMLGTINTNLQLLKDSLFSEKDLSQLCAMLQLLDGIVCPQDIMALILALKLLIKNYKSGLISIKLDWLSLFAPLIQGAIQLLTNFTNMLFGMIEAPLLCDLAVIQSNLSLLRTIDPVNFSTSKKDDSKLEIGFTGVSSSLEVKSLSLAPEDLKKAQEMYSPTPMIPTSINLNVSIGDLLSSPKGQSFLDLSAPEKMFVAFIEAKNNIENTKLKILNLIKNLNGLVHKGKLLEINNISALLYLTDLVAFLIQIAKYAPDGFKNLCEKNPEKITEIIKQLYPDTQVQIEKAETNLVLSLTKDDKTRTVNINSCASNKNINLDNVSKMLKEFEVKFNE